MRPIRNLPKPVICPTFSGDFTDFLFNKRGEKPRNPFYQKGIPPLTEPGAKLASPYVPAELGEREVADVPLARRHALDGSEPDRLCDRSIPSLPILFLTEPP